MSISAPNERVLDGFADYLKVEKGLARLSVEAYIRDRNSSLSLFSSKDRRAPRFARMNQASGDSRTYVVRRELSVVGYYSLAPGGISRKEATVRASKSAPEPIPIVLLARLAVDKREQGQGLGSALLKDALQRAYAGAEIIGGRAVLVHAIEAEAATFYRKYGFESCPGLELHLMLLMKDVRASLGL